MHYEEPENIIITACYYQELPCKDMIYYKLLLSFITMMSPILYCTIDLLSFPMIMVTTICVFTLQLLYF